MSHMIKKLLERLTEIGMSEAELARQINETDQAFHNWKVRGNIPSKKVGKVAIAVGLTTDDLLMDNEQKLARSANHKHQKHDDDTGTVGLSREAIAVAKKFDCIKSSVHRDCIQKTLDAFAPKGDVKKKTG